MINIKKCVTNGAQVTFSHYKDGSLWYVTVEDNLFPVPVSDAGNAEFKAVDKASLFMRYMRQWNKIVENKNG